MGKGYATDLISANIIDTEINCPGPGISPGRASPWGANIRPPHASSVHRSAVTALLDDGAAGTEWPRRSASACGYQELSAPFAIPTTAGQAGAKVVYLCILRAWRERLHLPR